MVGTAFLDHVQRLFLQNQVLVWEYTAGVPQAAFHRDRALVEFSLFHLQVLQRELWKEGG